MDLSVPYILHRKTHVTYFTPSYFFFFGGWGGVGVGAGVTGVEVSEGAGGNIL